jgi:hypothetical protein
LFARAGTATLEEGGMRGIHDTAWKAGFLNYMRVSALGKWKNELSEVHHPQK